MSAPGRIKLAAYFRRPRMKPTSLALALALLAPTAFAGEAGATITTAISELGEINGIALACQQPAIASRARNAMQTGAPKTRANGELFENATSTAFVAQGKGQACPDGATLSARLSNAEQALGTASGR